MRLINSYGEPWLTTIFWASLEKNFSTNSYPILAFNRKIAYGLSFLAVNRNFYKLAFPMTWVEGPFRAFFCTSFAYVVMYRKLRWFFFCLLCRRHQWPWWLPGKYGASNRPMATSSGSAWSPGCALLGDTCRIAPAHLHGHWNGQRTSCIFFTVN